MVRRFEAAALGALALHAALIGLCALLTDPPPPARRPGTLPTRPLLETEISIRFDDSAGDPPPASSPQALAARRSVPAKGKPTLETPSGDGADLQAKQAFQQSESTEMGEGDGVESSPGDAPRPNGHEPRRAINLGLDGSIARDKLLERTQRVGPPSRPRPVFTMDLWSENTVRSAAARAAPLEGSALLTIEWDAEGTLLSVATSAQSSDHESWQRFAETLRPQLARRQNHANGTNGLRLVYLIKSEVTLPVNKRSLLPSTRHASAERIEGDSLTPPAQMLLFGVKADSGPASSRVVSVTLASSQAL